MTSKLKQISLGTVAVTALIFGLPAATSAQSLAVTCDASAGGSSTATDLCDDADMTAVETAVNQNEADITAIEGVNTAQDTALTDAVTAQGVVDAAQDTALTDAVTAQGVVDAAQDTALTDAVTAQGVVDAAQDTALTDAVTAQGVVDAAQDTALTDAVTAQGVVDAAQDVIIGENTAAIGVNAGAIAVLDDRVTVNEADIAANSANIATNAADIADLQGGLADLRTDMNRGLAMANAMDVFAPDQGSQFMLNVGTGFHDGEAAFGITGSGRVGATGSTIVYFGVAGAEGTTAGKAGVAFQW